MRLGGKYKDTETKDYRQTLKYFLPHHEPTSQHAKQEQEPCITNPAADLRPRHNKSWSRRTKNSRTTSPPSPTNRHRSEHQTCLQSAHQVFQCLMEELAWLKITHPWIWEDKDYCDLNWISKAPSSQAANQPGIHVGAMTWNTIIPSATCTELFGHLPANSTLT